MDDVANAPVISLTHGSLAFDVGKRRRDPNGIKTHALDVIKMIDDTSPSTTTVLEGGCIARNVVGGTVADILESKSIRHDLKRR